MAISNWILLQAAKLPVVGKYAERELESRTLNEQATPEHEAYLERNGGVEPPSEIDDKNSALAHTELVARDDEDVPAYEPPGDYRTTTSHGLDDAGRLHRDPREGPAEVIERHQDWGAGYGSTERTERYVVHGGEIARAEISSSRDEESSKYTEKWYDKDGKLHSFNGNPSVVRYSDHYILSETYLDESVSEFHHHGQFRDMHFHTYDDVVRHKGLPLEALQQFGYDPDPDYEPEPKTKYPGRFDEPSGVDRSVLGLLHDRQERADPQEPDWEFLCEQVAEDAITHRDTHEPDTGR